MDDKFLSIKQLEDALKGFFRLPIPSFWTITEPDPGGMIGGGGDNRINEKGEFVYSSYEAKRWPSFEECENSDEWTKYFNKTYYGSSYKIIEINNLTEQPRNFSEEEIKFLLIDLLAHKLLIRDHIASKQ